MRQIVSNFLNTDKSIIGRKFPGGPFFFPGFGSGVRMPILSSSGGFPSFAVVLSMCYIFVNRRGAYFICSACMSSIPLLLPFFMLLAASYISSPVKGVIMAHGA